MTRSVRPLLDKAEAALVEAKRRVRPDPLADLSPQARRMVEAWYADRSPEQIWAAWLDGTHILSGSDVDVSSMNIPVDATLIELQEIYESIR